MTEWKRPKAKPVQNVHKTKWLLSNKLALKCMKWVRSFKYRRDGDPSTVLTWVTIFCHQNQIMQFQKSHSIYLIISLPSDSLSLLKRERPQVFKLCDKQIVWFCLIVFLSSVPLKNTLGHPQSSPLVYNLRKYKYTTIWEKKKKNLFCFEFL